MLKQIVECLFSKCSFIVPVSRISWLKSTYKIQQFHSKDGHGTIGEREEKPF
jgi:hypothetical protein